MTTPDTSNGSQDHGAAYLYRRTGASWDQTRYVKSSMVGTISSGDWLGTAVALDRNGGLVVGAAAEDSGSTTASNELAPTSGAFYSLR